MALNRNRFKYNKPKSANASRGSLIQLRKLDDDNVKLITSIKETCLNDQLLWQNYKISSTSLYKSTQLEENFSDKEKELEGVLKEKPPQMFSFGLVRTKSHADDIFGKSAIQQFHILHVPLGDPSKGVNVVKHADVMMTWAFKKRIQRPWLIVYKIMVGRSKNVKPRFVSQAPQVNPTPNADSHQCKEVDTKSDLVCEQLNQSQIFLFEFDNRGHASKHPRHCLPYALISCHQRQVPIPPTLTSSSNPRKEVNVKKRSSGDDTEDSPQQSSRSDVTRQEPVSSLSQEEGITLSRYLQSGSLTIQDLDSNQLDSKLTDIKKQREDVMKKLKAIQSMRDALTSGSCSSESEQEIDHALSMIEKSPATVDRKIAQGMSSSADLRTSEKETSNECLSPNHDSNQNGKSSSHVSARLERIASTSGWRDPYHWTPYQSQRNDTVQSSSEQRQEQSQEFDYYNNDEQSEMFDLEELIYAGRMSVKKTDMKPPDKYTSPGRFHDDVVEVPKPVGIKNDEEDKPCQISHDDGINIQSQICSNAEVRNDSSSSPSFSLAHQGQEPTSEFNPHQSYSSSTHLMASDVIRTNPTPSPSFDSPYKGHGLTPTTEFTPKKYTCSTRESSMQDMDRNNCNSSPSFGSPYKTQGLMLKSEYTPPKTYSESGIGGDNQLASNIPVQDMNINNPTVSPSFSPYKAQGGASASESTSPMNDNCSPFGRSIVGGDSQLTSNIPVIHRNLNNPTIDPGVSYPYKVQGVAPTQEFSPFHEYSHSTFGSSVAGDNNHLISNIPVQDMNMNTPSASSNCSSFYNTQGVAPTSEFSPSDSYSHSTFEGSVAGGDNHLTSNIQVQDMDIDESSQSSNSRGSFGNPSQSTFGSLGNPTTMFQTTNPPVYQSIPTLYTSQSCSSSLYNISTQSYTNSVGKVSSVPQVDMPAMSTVQCNNATPPISQDYNNSFNYGSMHTGAQTTLNLPHQQYSTQNPSNSDPLGINTSYLPPNSTPASSLDTPKSDFSNSKVVSRGADGRLRLTSESSGPVERPNIVFERPLSSEEQYPEGVMSPSGPIIPHFEYESNLMEPENVVSDCPPAKTQESSSSDGTHSTIEALHKELMQTKDPTQIHALQIVMNTLLAKILAPPKEDEVKPKIASVPSVTGNPSSVQPPGSVTSNADASVKPPPNAKVPKPKAKVVKMFHGRPLIKKGGKKPPHPILLEQLSSGPKPIDPRPTHLSLLGRQFDISLAMVPWARSISPVIKQPKAVDSSDKIGEQPSVPNIFRDPRIRKQILTNVLTAVASTKETSSAKTLITANKEVKISPTKDKKVAAKQACQPDQKTPDEELEVLGTYHTYGRDTPESGELSDSPVRYDTRTVVLENNNRAEVRKLDLATKNKPGKGKQQIKMLEKLKYVQDIDASIPVVKTERKVHMVPQNSDTVFDRLGTKRKNRVDDRFDLRQKIRGKKSDIVTGYQIRDQFLHSEESNDSSVMELKCWSPPSASSESFADSFKWYDRKSDDTIPTLESVVDRCGESKRSPYEREMGAYVGDSDMVRDSQSKHRSWSDGYSRESDRSQRDWERSPSERSRELDSDYWQRDYRKRDDFHKDRRGRDRYQRDRKNKEHRSTSRERSSRRSLSKDRSSRSYQRDLSCDTRSWRDSSRDRSSTRSFSIDGSSQGSFTRDKSSQDSYSRGSSQRSRSKDRASARSSSQRSRSRDRASIRSESSISCFSQEGAHRNGEFFNASPVSWDGSRRPLSRSSSINSPFDEYNTGNQYATNKESNLDTFGSLDERLEKEHGIVPAKKRKVGNNSTSDLTNVGSEKKMDGRASYRNLCSSLSTLKESATRAARSFRELGRSERNARVERFQGRYKNLQDMAIRALEMHYEQDREPSDLDRDIQQRLLEMITDIESQREGLDKYKTTSDKDSGILGGTDSSKASKHRRERTRQDGIKDKSVPSLTSSDIANQMYDKRQKYSTMSPVRSSSGSSQKKRCP